MAKRQTPQEKKERSYERDRRNAFGQSSKGSRKAIPRRKKNTIRSNRRAASQPLRRPAGSLEEFADIENEVKGRKPRQWTKSPDVPLKEFLEVQARRRKTREGRKKERKKAAKGTAG